MKKLIFALAAAVTMVAGAAQAERYVMVTHGEGKDPFWPVVQKGGEDAARHVGADFEYIFNPCLLYTSPSPRDATLSRMPSSA